MHEILGRSAGNVAEVRFRESIDTADIATLNRELDALIERYGKSRLLWDLSEIREGDASMLFQPGTLEIPNAGNVERVALIVGPEISGLSSRPSGSLPGFEAAETGVFTTDTRSKAMDWLTA